MKNFNGSANLILDIQGTPGGLLLAAGSVDHKNTYVFEVMPTRVHEGIAKSFSYWSIANGDDTMVTLWNPADEAQDFIFTLFFTGGHYDFPIHLEARATRTFNVSEIIHNQIPDAEGNIIPATVHEGSARISGTLGNAQSILVSMDAGTYNVVKATCGEGCNTCDGSVPGDQIEVTPMGMGVGGTDTVKFIVPYKDGGQHDFTAQATWKTSNTSIATVQSAGVIKGVAAGSFTTTATASVPPAIPCCNLTGGCCAPASPLSGSGPGNVIVITSIDPNPIMIGTSPPNGQLTINGSGFGSSPTVNLPSGVTSTGQGSTDTQIILTGVNVALTATVGNNNVTVSADGGKSAPASLTIDGPYQLVVQSDNTFLCSGCTTTVERDVTYQIRNFSSENAGTTSICETVTYSGWNCQQAQNIQYRQCSAPATTNSVGVFTDAWSLNSDGYTPVGCGLNVLDHWDWAAHSPVQDLGTLTGYLHTNAVSINGVVSPNKIPTGTVIPF